GLSADASSDPDGDGLSNLQEYQHGTDPNDYYNGVPVQLQMIGGNLQSHAGKGVFAEPLIVKVSQTNGTALVNAPVQIALTQGEAVLLTGVTGTNGVTSLPARTDAQGLAQIYVSSTRDEAGTLAVEFTQDGGSAQVTFALQVTTPQAPTLSSPIRGYSGSVVGLGTNGSWSVWGRSHLGQSGLNTETLLDSPRLLGQYTDVVTGLSHGLAVSNGMLLVWGDNTYGQLGTGTNAGSLTPLNAAGRGDISQVASGDKHSLAILTNGLLIAWGDNRYGQVAGPSNQTIVTTPQLVSGVSNITQVAGGRGFSIALDDQGRVFTWGDNRQGQLSQVLQTKANPVPAQIAPLTHIIKISAGSTHAGALSSNGVLWVWGANSSGQLGLGSRINQRSPQILTNLGVVKDFGLGAAHSVILLTNGNIYVAGANHNHQLGTNTGILLNPTPVLLTNLPAAVSVSVVGDSSFIRLTNGSYLVWGENRFGQLGVSNTVQQIAPVPMGGLQ
ncbi:MAG: hypothetical protein SGI98_10025, partial [Verrucomicrobiota bacterium]|nr:hypothetical protein [Verrucomicrobiota bacterium]